MSFKPHRDSRPLEQRPLYAQLEAQFHMAIRDKLTKRQQGYVMGAFRAALANYRVKTPEQTARSVEFTQEQAQKLLSILSTLQKSYQDAAIASGGKGMEELNAHYQKEMTELSAIKVKLMVCVLMEVGNDVSGV